MVWQVDTAGNRTATAEGVACHGLATGLDGQVVGEATPMDVTTTTGVGVWRVNAARLREWLQAPSLVPVQRAWIARDKESRSYFWTGIGAGSP